MKEIMIKYLQKQCHLAPLPMVITNGSGVKIQNNYHTHTTAQKRKITMITEEVAVEEAAVVVMNQAEDTSMVENKTGSHLIQK